MLAQNSDSRFPDLFQGGFRSVICQAGRKALDYQSRIDPVCKSDGTLVTPADQEIEADLQAWLAVNDPGSQVLGEEGIAKSGVPEAGFDFSRRSWVIDPIDGTALYSFRMPGWGISIGLMENGSMSDGLVLFPSATPGPTSLILGGRGKGVIRTWFDLFDESAPPADEESRPWKSLHGFESRYPMAPGFPGLLGISQTLAKHALYDGPHTILNTASCVISFLHLMTGSLVGYCAKVKLWDLAAVWPLAQRLGIKACDRDGRMLKADLGGGIWNLDPSAKSYLGEASHVLAYHPDRLDPVEFWKNLHWRDGKVL